MNWNNFMRRVADFRGGDLEIVHHGVFRGVVYEITRFDKVVTFECLWIVKRSPKTGLWTKSGWSRRNQRFPFRSDIRACRLQVQPDGRIRIGPRNPDQHWYCLLYPDGDLELLNRHIISQV